MSSAGTSSLSNITEKQPRLAVVSDRSGPGAAFVSSGNTWQRSGTAGSHPVNDTASVTSMQELGQDDQLRSYLRDFLFEYEALKRASLLRSR